MSNILLVTFHMFYQVVRSYQKREQIKVGSKPGESTSYGCSLSLGFWNLSDSKELSFKIFFKSIQGIPLKENSVPYLYP